MTARARLALLLAPALIAPALGSCELEPACGRAALEPLPSEPAYAVVASDYAATAIALLDASGAPVTSAWVDSGTTRAGLSTALSPDVVLPTTPVRAGELWWIDRLGVDLVTHVTVPSGRIEGQLPVTLSPERGEAAFRANPQDVLALGDERVLVSRFEPNLASDARPLDRGNDLVVLETGSGELSRRIALDAANTTVTREVDGEPEEIRIYARPSRMARAGERVVVGLGRLGAAFQTTGPGAVAVVDLAAGAVQVLELPGLRNCGEVVPVPGAPRRVAVACLGSAFPDTAADRRRNAGVAVVEVAADGKAEVVHLWQASEHPEAPAVTHGLVALGPNELVVAAIGDDRAGTGDRLVRLDLATERARVLVESPGVYALGPGAFDPERGLLLVPDAAAGARRFRVEDATIEPLDTVEVSPCRGLPAREIRPLR